MTGQKPSWTMDDISPEARRAAAEAAEAAGMPLEVWLGQLIKYVSAMEQKGRDAAAPSPITDLAGADVAQAGNGPLQPREDLREAAPHGIGVPPLPDEDAGPLPPADDGIAAPRQDAVTRIDPSPSPDDAAAAAPMAAPPSEPTPARSPTAESSSTAVSESNATPAPATAAETTPAETLGAGDTIALGAVVEGPSTPSPEAAPMPRQPAGDQWSVGMVAVDRLRPSRHAGEHGPTEGDVDAAIDAWRRDGGIEPIAVRRDPHAPDTYEIIAGADRWEAARRVEIKEVPVLIKDLSDSEALKAVLVQQLRRKSISPVEEAEIYRRLMQEAALSLPELAKTVGRAPTYVSQSLQLLDLPDAVQKFVRDGELTALHARALLNAPNPEGLAREAVGRRLDIYQMEQLVRSARHDPPVAHADNANDNLATAQILERQLSALLGLKVTITEHGSVGVLSVHYTDRDQLSQVIARLNSGGGT